MLMFILFHFFVGVVSCICLYAFCSLLYYNNNRFVMDSYKWLKYVRITLTVFLPQLIFMGRSIKAGHGIRLPCQMESYMD